MSLIYSITCLVKANLRQRRRDGKGKSKIQQAFVGTCALVTAHTSEEENTSSFDLLPFAISNPAGPSEGVDVPPLICALLFPLSRAFKALLPCLFFPHLFLLRAYKTPHLRVTGGLAAI